MAPIRFLFLVTRLQFAGQRLDGVALENAAGKTWPKKWKARWVGTVQVIKLWVHVLLWLR